MIWFVLAIIGLLFYTGRASIMTILGALILGPVLWFISLFLMLFGGIFSLFLLVYFINLVK